MIKSSPDEQCRKVRWLNKDAHPTACEDGDLDGGWAHSIELMVDHLLQAVFRRGEFDGEQKRRNTGRRTLGGGRC